MSYHENGGQMQGAVPIKGHVPVATEVEASRNPFSAERSGYGHIVNGVFSSVYPEGSTMHYFHRSAHDYVGNFIRSRKFPCILGQAAVKTDQYSFSAFDDITDPKVAEGVLHDIVRFQDEFGVPSKTTGERGLFRTVLVAFRNPEITDELHGAEVLYTLLQNMHQINSQHYSWTEGFSNDLESPDFGYSAGESAHFIALFHPHAYAPARVSDVQFLVFNSHHVVNAFKAQGMEKHARAKEIIRGRQQQPIHPYLGNHGDVLEWRQYSLLTPDQDTEVKELELREKTLGKCPFQPPVSKQGEEGKHHQ